MLMFSKALSPSCITRTLTPMPCYQSGLNDNTKHMQGRVQFLFILFYFQEVNQLLKIYNKCLLAQ